MRDEDEYRQFTPRTLGDLLWFSMAIHCLFCGHKVEVDLRTWIRRLGTDRPYKDFRRRLKCSKCGQKGVYETFRRLPR